MASMLRPLPGRVFIDMRSIFVHYEAFRLSDAGRTAEDLATPAPVEPSGIELAPPVESRAAS